MYLVDWKGLIVMATTIWKEARNQPNLGLKAVAAVIINRVNSKGWPDTIEEVCFQPWQFSAWNNGDPNRHKMPDPKNAWDLRNYEKAMEAAHWAMKNQRECKEFGDHYHTTSVKPNWSDPDKYIATIGDHIFMDLRSD